jgi:hypothetical protein
VYSFSGAFSPTPERAFVMPFEATHATSVTGPMLYHACVAIT